MRLPRPLALAVLIPLLTLAACGSDDDSSDSDPSDTSAPTSAGPVTSVAGNSGVELEDAGSEPRQPLRLTLTAGAQARAALITRFGIEMTVDGQALPAGVVPDTRMVLEQRVDRVDADGTIHYTATFSDIGVVAAPGGDPEIARQTEAALAELEGLSGTGTLDASGGNQTLEFDTGSITEPTLKTTIDSISSQVGNLAAPFPSDPVGAGARWTVTRRATINGITTDTTTHYTLRSRNGNRYELDLTQEAVAPPGPVEIPTLPAGTQASITSFEVQSTGELSGDLSRPLPTRSTMSGSGDGTFTVTVGGERATLVQHLTVNFELEPV